MCVRNSLQQALESVEFCDQVNDVKENITKEEIQQDYLALSTQSLRAVASYLDQNWNNYRKSKWHRLLTNTTQPAHLITIIAVAIISFLLLPNQKIESNRNTSPLLNLLYLGSVSAHFGTQLWMSFVSGLTLYFTLPRRIFGKVQKVLFPKYFLVNSILSLISLSIFIKNNNGKLFLPHIQLQVETLVLCFSLELIIRLYLTPPLLYFMGKAANYEEEAGIGMEIGKHKPGELARNKDYIHVYKSFRKLHMAIAIGNIVTLGCSVVHIHYLSSVIRFT